MMFLMVIVAISWLVAAAFFLALLGVARQCDTCALRRASRRTMLATVPARSGPRQRPPA